MDARSRWGAFVLALLLCTAQFGQAKAAAKPAGLDKAGQLAVVNSLAKSGQGAFSWTRLQNGIQFRVGQTVKNVLFYGPRIVRVNANLGQTHDILLSHLCLQ
jgi:alpha-D-xyloside xylohydrolase